MRFYNFCINHWLIPILEKYFGAGVNKKLSITYIVLPIVLSLYKIQILRTSCMMNSMKKKHYFEWFYNLFAWNRASGGGTW